MSTLKLVFKLDNDKTTTCSLADAREDLTPEEVTAAAQAIIDQRAILVNKSAPATIKSIYLTYSNKYCYNH